jgi:hypothetical protein
MSALRSHARSRSSDAVNRGSERRLDRSPMARSIHTLDERAIDAWIPFINIRGEQEAEHRGEHPFPEALRRVKGSLAPLAAVAPLTRPARSRVVGNYRSDGEIRASICFAFPRTSAIHQGDSVLCLDEPHFEAARSFHDVLLPRLVLACMADGARVRWGVVQLFRIQHRWRVSRPSTPAEPVLETKGGHRVFR